MEEEDREASPFSHGEETLAAVHSVSLLDEGCEEGPPQPCQP